MSRLYILLFLQIIAANITAQISVDNTLTADQLVQNVLIGSGISVSNVSSTGNDTMHGHFYNNYVIVDGVILSTGGTHNSLSPNDSSDAGDDLMLPGDPLLSILADTTTIDASILEFDFIPVYDTMSVSYSFASEDYPEFVCSVYNDPFGIFLSGPKPGGGNYIEENIALVAGFPVGVGTINPGVDGSNSNGNCMTFMFSYLYIDNTGGFYMSEYDGMTYLLEANSKVIPGQTYHLKIAIADAVDGNFDSAVLLKGNSLHTYGSATALEKEYSKSLNIVPNPADGSFDILSDFNIQTIDILSVDGFRIETFSGNTKTGINVQNLPDGYYFVRMTSAEGITTRPLIISH